MSIITKFHLFEKKEEKEFQPSKEVEKEILRFKKRWEIELDPHFTIKEIEVISEGIEYYNTKFIKSRIDKIIRKD